MSDMNVDDIVGDYQEHSLSLYGGGTKKVYVTEIETPFPEGKLIVSRTDTTGVITHCNAAFVYMSAYDEHELIGQPHSILRHPDIPKAAFKDAWDTIKNRQKWNGYIKNLRKDGGYYWTFATIIPNIRQGEIVGYASVRRKPAVNKVKETEALYKEMLAEES